MPITLAFRTSFATASAIVPAPVARSRCTGRAPATEAPYRLLREELRGVAGHEDARSHVQIDAPELRVPLDVRDRLARRAAPDQPVERAPLIDRDLVARIRFLTQDMPEEVLRLDALAATLPVVDRGRGLQDLDGVVQDRACLQRRASYPESVATLGPMPGSTPTGAAKPAKPAKPRKPRAKKTTAIGDDVRLTGDRLVVQLPENGERTSASGLLIPATAAPAPKRLAWADVKLVGPDVRVASQGDRVLFLPSSGLEVELDGQELVLLRERDVQAVSSPPASDARAKRAPGQYL